MPTLSVKQLPVLVGDTVERAKKVPSGRGPGRPPKNPDAPAKGVGPVPSLEASLAELLEGFNLIPQGLAAMGRLPLDDPLSDDEIKQLAHSLDTQAKRSPAFGRFLTKFVQGGESLGLLFVLASIGGKRVINHLPEKTLAKDQAELLKKMLAPNFLANLSSTPPGEFAYPLPAAPQTEQAGAAGTEAIAPVETPEF